MSDTRAALDRLVEALRDTREDLSSMPFFVRPMAKKGFASRTGLELDAWIALAEGLARRAAAGEATAALVDSQPRLRTQLEALAKNYAGAPERAARGMGRIPAVLERVQKSSTARESAVRELLRCLDA